MSPSGLTKARWLPLPAPSAPRCLPTQRWKTQIRQRRSGGGVIIFCLKNLEFVFKMIFPHISMILFRKNLYEKMHSVRLCLYRTVSTGPRVGLGFTCNYRSVTLKTPKNPAQARFLLTWADILFIALCQVPGLSNRPWQTLMPGLPLLPRASGDVITGNCQVRRERNVIFKMYCIFSAWINFTF